MIIYFKIFVKGDNVGDRGFWMSEQIMNKTYICRGGPVWPPVICSSKYMSIHINLWHLLVCSGAHTGAPLRVYVEIHKKLTHSKTVCCCAELAWQSIPNNRVAWRDLLKTNSEKGKLGKHKGACRVLVHLMRFERMAFRVGGWHFIRLSYRRISI